MKIKAIMLGLAVSGLLSLAIADDNLDIENESLEQKQANIDRLNINPLNPELIKGLAKAMIRIDDSLKENNRVTQSNYAEIGLLIQGVQQLRKEVKALKEEVKALKKEVKALKK